MTKVTNEKLDDLAATLVEDVTTRLKDGDTVLDKEGEPVKVSAPAAVLNAAVNLLKAANYQFIPKDGSEKGSEQEIAQRRLEKIRQKMQEETDVIDLESRR